MSMNGSKGNPEDDEIRRDALLVSAELHAKDGNSVRALEVYRRYVEYFPQPVELNLETRNNIAEILKAQNDRTPYLDELEKIVDIDASAGSARTPRTRSSCRTCRIGVGRAGI